MNSLNLMWRHSFSWIVCGVMVLLPALTIAENPDAITAKTVFVDDADNADYWIGVMFAPVGEQLKAHLGIKHGLIVQDVFENSPAADAGLKQHDIVVKVSDENITGISQLVELVKQSKGESIDVKVLREGKEKTLKVIPQLRPAEQAGMRRFTLPNELPPEIKERLERLMRERDKGFRDRDFGMWFMRPGLIMPKDFTEQFEFPKNWKVTISRDADGPIQLRVEADGKVWEATDEDLNKLPEKIQPWLKRSLEGYWGRLDSPERPRARVMIRPKSDAADSGDRVLEELREEIELREEMKRLRREIEELRKHRGADSGEKIET